tara:strand:+ start:9514 stop:10041 length:528 start_codon:yes stop_codon:yes gene_type:complete
MATYKPNVEGAINALVDLMTANAFTMTRKPYALNYRGLVDAIIDLKEGFPTFAPIRVGFDATTFEAVSNGDALYMRTADGQVGKATAANGNSEAASVVGFADSAVGSSNTVKVVVVGIKTLSGLDAGDLYYLSPSTAGAITKTPPSGSGQSITRLGEAATTADFSIQIEPPILLV